MFGKLALPAISAVLVLGILAGCSWSTPKTSTKLSGTNSSVSPSSKDPRWQSGKSASLKDSFTVSEPSVDPDGGSSNGDQSPAKASDPATPASIAANGNIYVTLLARAGEVSRSVAGYISTDAKGKEVGPAIKCEETIVNQLQTFTCSVQFRDQKYKSGTYYAVFVTKPLQDDEKKYGVLKRIVPVYTKPFG